MKKENILLQGSVVATEASEDIIAVAKTRGLDLPHPALAVFSSVLCEIERPNANKVRLGKKATEVALSSLIGTQINFNHERRGNICGYIFDSRLNEENEVEISCVYFKDIYDVEYEYAMSLFQEGNLTMSFELSAEVDTQEKLPDGTRRINDFYFTGAGLLINETPACDKAIVYEFAQKELECVFAQKEPQIMKTITKIYAKTNSKLVKAFKDVVEEKDINFDLATKFYSADDEEKELLNEDVQKWTKNYINNLENAQEETITMEFEEMKQSIIAELGEDVTKDWTDEDFKNEAKVEEAREEAKTTYTTDKEEKITEVFDEDSVLTIVEGEVTYSYENEDGEKSSTTRKYKNEEVYLYATVEKMKAEHKEEVELLKATLEAKDSEIEDVRANAEKIGKLKVELADNEFASEFEDEDYLDEAKVEEAKTAMANKIVIEERKEQLKDNEFASEFKDEDYLNEDKVELAKVKKELEDKKASEEKEDVEDVEDVENVEAISEDLDAGTNVIVAGSDPLKRLMRNKS